MSYLIAGLLLFLGVHSLGMVARSWRARMVQQRGEAVFKGAYSLVSALGFGLIVWGFCVARETPVVLWQPPMALRHMAILLMWVAFVLLAAAYVPSNALKARLHHPMVLGVKTWAVAHLMVTGTVANLVLFGAFLTWGVLLFIASRRRDRSEGTSYAAGTLLGTCATLAIGTSAWALFAFVLHGVLIGIRPLG